MQQEKNKVPTPEYTLSTIGKQVNEKLLGHLSYNYYHVFLFQRIIYSFLFRYFEMIVWHTVLC